ncbi:MAG: DUF1684 domain-containing protein [Halobacteriales archaeon]
MDRWEERLQREREQKDRFYAEHPRSPIPPDHRDGFEGLSYYPPEPSLRFELPLHEFDEQEPITVETSTEGEREYRRWGEFRFTVDGEELTLTAYKADPDEDRLWVPFRDATSGEATYGAGRYLDLEADEHRTDGGEWVLDFNQAYNPYCAYSDAYECPLIPMENWLEVPIEAGEKMYEPPEGATSHAH